MKKVLALIGAAFLSTVLAQTATPGTILEVASANKDFSVPVSAFSAAARASGPCADMALARADITASSVDFSCAA